MCVRWWSRVEFVCCAACEPSCSSCQLQGTSSTCPALPSRRALALSPVSKAPAWHKADLAAHWPPAGVTPGYGDEVIFADGTFIDGSTAELSAGKGPVEMRTSVQLLGQGGTAGMLCHGQASFCSLSQLACPASASRSAAVSSATYTQRLTACAYYCPTVLQMAPSGPPMWSTARVARTGLTGHMCSSRQWRQCGKLTARQQTK